MAGPVIEPLRLTFDVACSAGARVRGLDRAHRRRGGRPTTPSSGEPDLASCSRAGRRPDLRAHGRRRRARLGRGHAWEPPHRLGYLWHLRRDRARRHRGRDPLRRRDGDATRVEIEHRGWERLGADGRSLARPQPRRLEHPAAALHRRPRCEQRNGDDQWHRSGTKDDPWQLTTAPGSSAYTMYRDDEADPPLLVCQVGSTHAEVPRARDRRPARLAAEQGDWVPLGAADESKAAADGHGRGVGPRRGQPGRRLVRAAQGLPRPLRHVPAAAARGARPGRAHPRRPQQPGRARSSRGAASRSTRVPVSTWVAWRSACWTRPRC